jgi:ribosomal protein S18 acetylase RimI-like enzyme
MRIRPATLDDLDVVCDFNARLAWESEGKQLDDAVLRVGVRALLTDPAKGRYFVAESDGQVVGQLAFTYEWSDWRNGWFWWIQSVYVHPDHRRNGVFTSLCRYLEERAVAERDVIGIRLYVEAENDKAQATYDKLGLTKTTYGVREKYPLR